MPRDKPFHSVFVHAPDPYYADTQNYGARFAPLWAYTLAAHIPRDGRFTWALCDTRFDDLAATEAADVFLFSGINQDYSSLQRARTLVKNRFPTARTVIGGPICWSFDQAGDLDRLRGFDHIVIGDGELGFGQLLENLSKGLSGEQVVRAKGRFPIDQARPIDGALLSSTLGRYYGAVVEVSRGCPFLCEFCDIRVLEDNNRPHNKKPSVIIADIEQCCRLGARQILLACDNLIGDPRWAEHLVDCLLEWQERTGFRPSLYTWLTVNLFRHPRLMGKMRRAGFDMLFVGIESFTANSLLETAKLQNSATSLVDAVREIQSRGFIVVAGLIFGFDSDTPDSFRQTLDGLSASGLLSGDPSLLTALPGTPLFRRMKLAGRLRDVRYGLGGFKYQTNIKYLMPRDEMVNGYRSFVATYNSGEYQFQRLRNYFALLNQGHFVPLRSEGYGQLRLFAKNVAHNKAARRQLLLRIGRFAVAPRRVYFALRGLLFTLLQVKIPGRLGYLQFWLFAWSNSVLKYSSLSERDFDIESVAPDFDIRDVLPAGYAETADEPVPANKIAAQLHSTCKQLRQLIERRLHPSVP